MLAAKSSLSQKAVHCSLFALANAGIVISGSFLARAYSSPVTLGILIGYVAGKPAGITGASWLLTRLSRGRLRPPVGWAAVTGTGAIMGIGFTVSILIATLAFGGAQLEEATSSRRRRRGTRPVDTTNDPLSAPAAARIVVAARPGAGRPDLGGARECPASHPCPRRGAGGWCRRDGAPTAAPLVAPPPGGRPDGPASHHVRLRSRRGAEINGLECEMKGKVAPFDIELTYLPPKPPPGPGPAGVGPLVFNGGPIISSPELVSLFWGQFSGTEIGTMLEWLYGFAAFLSGAGAPVAQEQVAEQYGVCGARVGVTYHDPVLPAKPVGWPEVGQEIASLVAAGNLPPATPERIYIVFSRGLFPGHAAAGWCGVHGGGDGYRIAIVPYPDDERCGASTPMASWQSIARTRSSSPRPIPVAAVDGQPGGPQARPVTCVPGRKPCFHSGRFSWWRTTCKMRARSGHGWKSLT